MYQRPRQHLNLCLNKKLRSNAHHRVRAPEDTRRLLITLSGNPIEGAPIIKIHNAVTNLHKTRVQDARQADASAIVVEIDDIAQRRAAF